MKEQQKICRVCGRSFSWRKKWERDWHDIKTCSVACRKRGLRRIDEKIEAEILRQLGQITGNSTICPSDVARALFSDSEWREQMETVRMAARRLVDRSEVLITQKGSPIDASTATGPIRIRKA